MDFKRSITETTSKVEHLQNGDGYVEKRVILQAEEMFGKGRLFGHMVLHKGCSIGKHTHHGDCETYYILKGHGTYLYQGEYVEVGPGEVLFVDDGNTHELRNDHDEPLEFIALILYTE